MNIFNKLIWSQEFSYISGRNSNELKKYMDQVMTAHKGINLTGKFISENEFEITPRWQLIYIRSFEREISFLNGRIRTDQSNRTLLDFSVRPNSIFIFLHISNYCHI